MPDSKKKTLGELVDEIEAKEEAAINIILGLRYAKREKIDLGGEHPIAYNFVPGFADLIINTLADLCLSLIIPPEKKEPESMTTAKNLMLPFCRREADIIWAAVRKVGFSSRRPGGRQQRKEATLRCFDGNNENFEAIKRSYLEDNLLYEDSGGQEKRKFMSRLFLKVFKDILPLYGKKWRAIGLFNHSKKI